MILVCYLSICVHLILCFTFILTYSFFCGIKSVSHLCIFFFFWLLSIDCHLSRFTYKTIVFIVSFLKYFIWHLFCYFWESKLIISKHSMRYQTVLYTVGPQTMQGLEGNQPHTVENLHITSDSLNT